MRRTFKKARNPTRQVKTRWRIRRETEDDEDEAPPLIGHEHKADT